MSHEVRQDYARFARLRGMGKLDEPLAREVIERSSVGQRVVAQARASGDEMAGIAKMARNVGNSYKAKWQLRGMNPLAKLTLP